MKNIERIEKIKSKVKTYGAARRRNIRIACCTAAACLCLIIACNLILFVPYQTAGFYPDISDYEGTEYYSVVDKLRTLMYSEPQYTNNFNEWFNNKSYGVDASPPTVDSPDAGESGSYREVTNNQVGGVIEGDLFKRTDECIFYLNCGDMDLVLDAYSIDGEQSEKIASYSIHPENQDFIWSNYNASEMYLSSDGKTVTVFTLVFDKTAKVNYTAVIGIDVSDLSDIKQINTYYVSGNYVSSRLTGGEFLLVTQFAPNRSNFSDPRTILPHTGTTDGLRTVAAADIICPDDPTVAQYTVVVSLGEQSLEETGSYAFLSYTSQIYVSENNIFTTREYTVASDARGGVEYLNERFTEISCISYGGELKYEGSATVSGTVLDQYSMDEYEKVLRVVTSVSRTEVYTLKEYEGILHPNTNTVSVRNASLFCIDLDNFGQIASVECFAPDGEQVYSARFLQETAYVCTAYVTAIDVCDPVYAFDLSDYSNITYTDTGTIPGYSISLTHFYDGTLLGIGYDEDLNMKIEIYRETDSDVISVASYGYIPPEEVSVDFGDGYVRTYDTLESYATYTASDYKACFIDAENGLIGIPYCSRAIYYWYADADSDYRFGYEGYEDGKKYIYHNIIIYEQGYLLLQFDGENVNVLGKTVLYEEYFKDLNATRATIIDGYLYILDGYSFTVIPVNRQSD